MSNSPLSTAELFTCGHFLTTFPDDVTFDKIVELIREDDPAIVVWEPFEQYDCEWLVGQMEIMVDVFERYSEKEEGNG